MEQSKCAGPNGDIGESNRMIWWCNGSACKNNGTWKSCKPMIQQRGYEFRLTELGEKSTKGE